MTNEIKVFVSYAREDYDTAKRLYDDLKKQPGVIPWMDKIDLIVGQKWEKVIKDEIRGCSHFLALLSENSVSKRGFVQKELKTAFDELGRIPPDEIYIIPVRLDYSKPKHDELKELHWIDLFLDYEDGLNNILRAFSKPDLRITNTLGMNFIYIEPGTFMMGSPESELGRYDDETPLHKVRLTKGFYMQTTQVTQAQWKALMGDNPSYFKEDDNPVETVSWNDVQKFIKKMNKTEGENYRLPTEAEWEYA